MAGDQELKTQQINHWLRSLKVCTAPTSRLSKTVPVLMGGQRQKRRPQLNDQQVCHSKKLKPRSDTSSGGDGETSARAWAPSQDIGF